MMLMEKYVLTWFLLAGAGIALYLGGLVSDHLLMLGGLAMAGLVFMGMVIVVPLSLNEQDGAH